MRATAGSFHAVWYYGRALLRALELHNVRSTLRTNGAVAKSRLVISLTANIGGSICIGGFAEWHLEKVIGAIASL